MNCNDNFGRQHLPKRRKRKSPVIDPQSFKENWASKILYYKIQYFL